MFKPTLIGLFILLNFSALAQSSIDYNKIILPEGIDSTSTKEKLIQLAWQNSPQTGILENNLMIAEIKIKSAKLSWLDNIVASGNVNQFNIEPGSDAFDRSQFFPLYNFSVNIPLGIFTSVPQITKIARFEKDNQKKLINESKLVLRAEVLRRYETYLYYENVFKIQIDLTDNLQNTYALIESQFKNGEATLEQFTNISNSYNQQLINQLNAKNNLEIAKINLEEMIGIDLELAIAQ